MGSGSFYIYLCIFSWIFVNLKCLFVFSYYFISKYFHSVKLYLSKKRESEREKKRNRKTESQNEARVYSVSLYFESCNRNQSWFLRKTWPKYLVPRVPWEPFAPPHLSSPIYLNVEVLEEKIRGENNSEKHRKGTNLTAPNSSSEVPWPIGPENDCLAAGSLSYEWLKSTAVCSCIMHM